MRRMRRTVRIDGPPLLDVPRAARPGGSTAGCCRAACRCDATPDRDHSGKGLRSNSRAHSQTNQSEFGKRPRRRADEDRYPHWAERRPGDRRNRIGDARAGFGRAVRTGRCSGGHGDVRLVRPTEAARQPGKSRGNPRSMPFGPRQNVCDPLPANRSELLCLVPVLFDRPLQRCLPAVMRESQNAAFNSHVTHATS